MKNNFSKTWELLPQSLRKTIVFLVGSTLIVTGLLLIILPGPFTLPLVVLGLVVLALEFAWAESLLIRVRQQGAKINLKKLLRKKSEEAGISTHLSGEVPIGMKSLWNEAPIHLYFICSALCLWV